MWLRKHAATGGIVVIGLVILYFVLRPLPPPELGVADYPAEQEVSCAAGSRKGASGITNGLTTPKGLRFYVRTPQNYRADHAHPLLMVYASGSIGGLSSEASLGLTKAATSAGFIVAYADAMAPGMRSPIEMGNLMELGIVPSRVGEEWCVDTGRVFFTGHSNGGTVSTALAILPDSPARPAGIAPSAAGMTGEDVKAIGCRKPLPVLVQHSSGDHLFPGFGAQTSRWWATCNQCSGATEKDSNGCLVYQGCKAATVYCEGNESHATWPNRNGGILEFFSSIKSSPPTGP